MKNRRLATTVAIGLATRLMLFSTGEVDASKTSLLLKHNAYVYDQNGRRSRIPLTLTYDYSKRKSIFKVSLIHKGNQQPISGVKYIKGKKYYRVAKNRYIKAGTVTWNYFATTKDGGAPIRKSPTSPASEEDGVIGGQRIKIRGKANGADGYVWYRIGKDEWVSSKYTSIPSKAKGIIPQVDKKPEVESQSSILTPSGNNQNQSKNNTQIITQDKNNHKDDQVTYKGNIADYMDWLVQNPRLTEAQKANAKDAAEIIRGQGNVPSWYSTYVNINDSRDAASAMILAKTLDYYGRTNQIRINKGLPILKVSFRMIAKSIVSVDYQKRGGLEHSGYGSFENLAAGQGSAGRLDERRSYMEIQCKYQSIIGRSRIS